MERTNSVARSTLIIMAGWGAAIIIGLVRQQVIASAFGTTAETDAFFAANIIPELLYTMLSGGALSFAFIPIYTELITGEKEGDSNRLLSQVANLVFLAFAVVAVLAGLFAPGLVAGRLGVGVGFEPATQQLTAQLMRILLFSNAIFAVSSILTATLYAHKHFIVPALLPSMYSLGIIAGTLLLGPSMGIYGVAIGALLGSAMHFAIQVPVVLRYDVRWKPVLDFGDETLRAVLILMAPRVIDLLLARASISWIGTNLTSELGEGRVTALSFAFTLMNMPWTLIGTSIGIVIFPTMAELAAKKDLAAQREALSGALRAILTLAIPAAVGLIVLGEPIIRVLFERGEFTAQSTQLVYYALQFYTVALLSQSMLEVVVRAFAAQKDTYTPLYVSVFTTALNIGLAVWLTDPARISHAGPALANGVAVGVEALIGLTILSIRWQGVNAGQIVLDAAKATFAAGLMAGVILGVDALLQPGDLVLIAVGGTAGVLVYFTTALLLGIREIRDIPLGVINSFLKPAKSPA